MSEALREWFGRRRALPGMQACGLRLPGQGVSTQICEPDFSPEALESAWRVVADTFEVLQHHECPARALCWAFEQSLLHCLARSDGACLMVFSTRKAQELDAAGLQGFFDEFLDFASAPAPPTPPRPGPGGG